VTTKVGVVLFPGSNCEQDVIEAIERLGGEGSILGVIIGATLMRVLYNAINILGIPTYLEPAIIGAVILVGVIVDELVKRVTARRRAARAATDAKTPVAQPASV
jgi:ABC-type glucose/galactose transport system permease subunit